MILSLILIPLFIGAVTLLVSLRNTEEPLIDNDTYAESGINF